LDPNTAVVAGYNGLPFAALRFTVVDGFLGTDQKFYAGSRPETVFLYF
jgi:hypothetical protein